MVAMVDQIDAQKKGRPIHAAIEASTHKDVALTTLSLKQKKFVGKLSPTLAVKGAYMVVGTRPDVVRAVLDAHDGAPAVKAGKGNVFAGGGLDVSGVRELIRRYRRFFIRDEVKKGKPEEKVRADIAGIEFVLSFIDRMDFRAVRTPGRVDRSFGIRYADIKPAAPGAVEMPVGVP
jgi:hypothetical protein